MGHFFSFNLFSTAVTLIWRVLLSLHVFVLTSVQHPQKYGKCISIHTAHTLLEFIQRQECMRRHLTGTLSNQVLTTSFTITYFPVTSSCTLVPLFLFHEPIQWLLPCALGEVPAKSPWSVHKSIKSCVASQQRDWFHLVPLSGISLMIFLLNTYLSSCLDVRASFSGK